MFSNRYLQRVGRIIPVCFLFFTAVATGAEIQKKNSAATAELVSLDNRFQKFSSHFYASLVRRDNTAKVDNIDALVQSIDRYRGQNQPVAATTIIINNLALVEKNIDTTPIISIFGMLLETNEWNTASQLLKKLRKQGDKTLVSNVSFSLAKYYFSRNQWKETIGIVESIRSDLPPEDFHHALLMHGISLQHLQKHRTALGEYAKIPSTSRYYAAARLNMAVANIRQDWWTDAHIIISELLNDSGRKHENELTDRLNTVLGYSLLQQHYFRNSRDAFRNVSLDGKYTSKALLGLALTAAYQEDYVGALHAVKILKNHQVRDLPVDEATLLLPHFYEKLKQLTTASAGYFEAVNYYEHRIQSLKNLMPDDLAVFRNQLVATNSSTVAISGEVLDLGDKLPKSVFDDIRMLALFQTHVVRIGDAALSREYGTLINDYQNVLRKAAQLVLDERVFHLTHYMNQSRYGLARMQDHDAVSPQ